MRLIDADVNLEKLRFEKDMDRGDVYDGREQDLITHTFGAAIDIINEAPTVDAAPVVHCEKCMYAKTAVSHPQWNCNHFQSPCYRRRVRGIDHCAYGAKMDKEDEGE